MDGRAGPSGQTTEEESADQAAQFESAGEGPAGADGYTDDQGEPQEGTATMSKKSETRCVVDGCRRHKVGSDSKCPDHSADWPYSQRRTRRTKTWAPAEPMLLPNGEQRPRDPEREQTMWAAQELRLREWAADVHMPVFKREHWIKKERSVFFEHLDNAYKTDVDSERERG